MNNNFTPYLIPPLLSLITGYILAAVSITRKKLSEENIMLSMICIWWTLLSWAFIWHNIETDTLVLMSVERIVHTFYVFTPAVTLLFFQTITGLKNRIILLLTFLICTVISAYVHTDLYFYGFRHYPWGMIATPGPAFYLFAAYGNLLTFYIIYLIIKKLKTEKNRLVRLKINYLMISYLLSLLLSMTNIPAMNGINFYPLSNFIFIPLGIMTYGIVKYRLINISIALQYSIFWAILSSVVAIPNIFIFIHIQKFFPRLNAFILMLIFIIWFAANYFYFNRIQPVINRMLNRKHFNLKETEKNFMRDIGLLKNLENLIREVTQILKKNLELSHARLFLRGTNRNFFRNEESDNIRINDATLEFLAGFQEIYIQKSILETEINPDFSSAEILSLLNDHGSEYLIPLVNQKELIALIFLSEKTDSRQFSGGEIRFIKNISAYAGISLANSVMFQTLTEIKDHLEFMVEERTALIEQQKSELESDVQLARKIQMSLLPKNIPSIKKARVAYRYQPVMGVGGDFIDVHYREGMDDMGLFICDVSGHGASSAMIASMVKMSLNSWGKYIQKPGEAFAEMKRLLSGKIGDNFLSAFMCSIDLNTGIVTSACAGHPPMIILRKNGDTELIKPKGKIILDIAESEYEENKNRLNTGDMVILYTDGVLEARLSSGEMLGDDRFIEMLKKYTGLSSYALCSSIYDEIFNKSYETVIEDDFALLVAEYTG